MNIFLYILISTFLISIISFIGVLALFFKKELLDKVLLILVAFSAGGLLGGAFLHLLPEAIDELGLDLNIFLSLLAGFCAFFILEHFIMWHHHHSTEHPEIKPFSYLILISDSIHNFIDGLIIAGSFAVGFPLGIITSLAVAFHEIPQEIGDFGVLVYGGFKRSKALFLNFLTAITVVIGGIIGFLLSENIGHSIVFLLPFAAGTFIYIACSDLIPEIKHNKDFKKSIIYFIIFILGIGLMLLLKLI